MPPNPLAVPTFSATVPLTTIFTPYPSCASAPWVSYASTQGVLSCSQSVATTPACFPPEFSYIQANAGIYSPGLCPYSYAVARSWTVSSANDTTSICCPSGMDYLQPLSSCASVVTTPAEVLINNNTVLYSAGFTALAPTIAVARASTDLLNIAQSSAPLVLATTLPTLSNSSSSSVPPTTSVGSISSSIAPISSPAASSSVTTSPPSNSGLPSGTKAGIGVGVAAAAVLGLAAGAWLVWRRRTKNTPKPNAEQPTLLKAELPGADAEKKFSELGVDAQVSEVNGTKDPVEMGHDERHELDSGWRGTEAVDAMSPREAPTVVDEVNPRDSRDGHR